MKFALLSLLALATVPARAADLSLPLTAPGLASYLASHPAATLDEFLAALPPSLHENFVLMHASKSLHQATPSAPRQILFGSDARFLLAASGVTTDPRYQLLEFAEFDATSGRYRFGTIDFSRAGLPTVTEDVARCAGCHGTPTRPIWGQYPRWEGAYGDEHGTVDAAVKEAFAAFVTASGASPRYRHLVFAKDPSGVTFELSARYYPYPNTDFNHELGNTVALGTLTRLKKSAGYNRWRHAALATNPALSCIDSDAWATVVRRVNAAYSGIQDRFPPTSRPDVKVLRLLGVDPVTELSLEQLAGDAGRGSGAQYQTGAYRLEEALGFQLLLDVMAEDATLKNAFADARETIDFIAGKARLIGADRADALRRSSSWFLFFDVFDPVTASDSRLDAVCGRLAELLGETP